MFSDPEKNLKQFSLFAGLHVADLGAGSGFYVLPAARLVGDKGRVFAVDIQKDILGRIKNDAKAEHLDNVEVIWGNIEKEGGTRLKDSSIDRAIISNVLFQLEDKNSFVKETHRLLKPRGKALVIDWDQSSGKSGPGKDLLFSRDQAVGLFTKSGFELEKEFLAGDQHYGLIFVKKNPAKDQQM